MKPIIILPPDQMSEEHIKMLRENDLCVVVAKNPAAVKFVDPIPAASSRNQIDDAAIKLSRIVLNGAWGGVTNSNYIGVSEASRLYLQLLVEGTSLDIKGSRQDREQEYFNEAKMDELRRLAREEAKAERLAAKSEAKVKAK